MSTHRDDADRPAEQARMNEELRRAGDASGVAARQLLTAAVRALKEGRTEDAVGHLARVREEYPKRPEAIEARFHLGQAYLANDKNEDAAAEFAAYVDEAPQDAKVPEARMGRAQALRKSGATGEALDEYKAIIADHPGSPLVTRAMFGAAELHESRGEVSDAVPLYEQVMGRTGPTDPLHGKAKEALARLKGGGGERPAPEEPAQQE